LWAKAGAVGNADALSTASRPVREAHRPQIHSLVGAEGAAPPAPSRKPLGGAMKEDVGSIRTGIKGPGGGAHAAARERRTAAGGA
jgi:hypothetical protein